MCIRDSNKGKWDVGLRNQYNYRDKAIMPHIYREDDRFIHSYANHSNFQDWTVGLDARVGMLWDVLQLSGSIESRKYWSNGIDFRHTQHSIGWDVAATFMYKNFTASVEFQHNSDYFFGEVLATGEEAHAIDLQYRWKRLNVGLRMFNPFQKDYKRNEADWNKYAGYSLSLIHILPAPDPLHGSNSLPTLNKKRKLLRSLLFLSRN